MNLELRFGQPNSYDFDTILDQFSGTKINSFRTSSIPLVQFWKETDSKLNELFHKIGLHSDKQVLCFEYPTKPQEGIGKASMTDLMILCDDFKIAIEAKFTEYAKMKPDPINKWKQKGNNEANKQKVLDYWTSLIRPFSNGFDNDSLQKISYQFYHRTASACKVLGKAIVIYQVFYDKDTYGFLENFKSKLRDYISILNPNDKLSFYIWEIEVIQKVTDNNENDPFTQMKFQNIYEFIKTDLYKM
ncbi:MAG: hypothetical protein NTY07_05795 [Bacteroidia bacterium]|nr:hypothetical protein [Bacteroidia bacterium]